MGGFGKESLTCVEAAPFVSDQRQENRQHFLKCAPKNFNGSKGSGNVNLDFISG
jgi:hypothetical protein